MVNALESQSTHPVATAIHKYVGNDKYIYST
jgi:cation transport ATPase